MPIPTGAASSWPARCAYLSSAIFIAASGTTNVVYGFGKGDSLATSCVWAGVAGAAAIVLALSWAAIIRSVDQRRWSAAAISLVAMLLSGTYSVSAALGSASGGRANAAATEQATTDARIKAQAAYDAAKSELDTLSTARPSAEIQLQIEATRAELAKLAPSRTVPEIEALMKRGCPTAAALNGHGKASCPKYDVELARAWERQRLTAKIAELGKDATRADERLAGQRTAAREAMEKASAELARIQPARIANSDAKALARYITALGLEVGPDRLNDLLVLLAVIMVEFGGGLSLAIGMALSGPVREATAAPASAPSVQPIQPDRPPALKLDAPARTLPDTSTEHQTTLRPVASVRRPEVSCGVPATSDLTKWLRQQGGRAETSMRRLASVLGRSPSGVHEELRRLVASGVLIAASGPRGTVLSFATRSTCASLVNNQLQTSSINVHRLAGDSSARGPRYGCRS
jgi:hypothetical protein